ncbi:hypothetical protein R5R35_011207 [Gryllus longicercus]|uniref:ornithine carbamoyltransferase n=1 Tax=Gryllus longicercus TaxID=2509291 RepID=A0AAN9W488_9ORTH
MSLKSSIPILKPKLFRVCLRQARYTCESSSIIGRDFISPEDFSAKDIKKFLWIAKDFKHSKGVKCSQILGGIRNCNATVIMAKPQVYCQVSISNALHYLGCSTNLVIDENWEKSSCGITDLGRALSKITNVIIAVGCHHDSVIALRDGASVPVVNFKSSSFQLLACLGNLLTVQECYGFLKGLKIAWIGPSHAALYTYIFLSPKLNMNIQFTATCGEDQVENQDLLQIAIRYASKCGAEVTQCLEAKDAVYRAHAIITTRHSFPELQITREMLSQAAVNWSFLHHLPRSDIEACADVFKSKNSLVWEGYENQMWTFMAVIVSLLSGYEPSSKMPDFDGCNVPPEKFYQP